LGNLIGEQDSKGGLMIFKILIVFSAFAKVDQVAPVREARGFLDCFTSCVTSLGGMLNPAATPICGAKCSVYGRKLEDMPLKSLSKTFISSSAQPIDQGQFL
jgi:predicted oxidoreductase